jgi:hypothetical protein
MLKFKSQKAKFMKCLVIVFVSITTSSCQTKEDKILKKIFGQWDIYEFTFNDKDCEKDLLLNYIIFQKEEKFSIPEIFNYLAEDEEDNTKWVVQIDSTENVKLILDCNNPIFKGDYKVTFFKNYEKRLLGIELKSNTTYIKAYKALQNFDYNGREW